MNARGMGAAIAIAGLLGAASSSAMTREEAAALLQSKPIMTDENGLIVHLGNDGGDTAQREGWYWLAKFVRERVLKMPPAELNWVTLKWDSKDGKFVETEHRQERGMTFSNVLDRLTSKAEPGLFVRHPNWRADDADHGLSRDQLIPLVAAMGVWGEGERLKLFWNSLPEDVLGKHAPNKGYKGLGGQNCGDVEQWGCDAKENACPITFVVTSCPAANLNPLGLSCDSTVDNKNCAKAAACDQSNPLEKAYCEAVTKPLAQGGCQLHSTVVNGAALIGKVGCEGAKLAANAAWSTRCNLAKGAENDWRRAQKVSCDVKESAVVALCKANKLAAKLLCEAGKHHEGDLILPSTRNLFHRAGMLAGVPDLIPGISLEEGDAHLLINAELRKNPKFTNQALEAMNKFTDKLNQVFGGKPMEDKATDPRDDVGNDLNLIVELIIANLSADTVISEHATREYWSRPASYGSQILQYYETLPANFPNVAGAAGFTNMAGIIAQHMSDGSWQPEAAGPVGAVRWYHRTANNANSALAELYVPVLNNFLAPEPSQPRPVSPQFRSRMLASCIGDGGVAGVTAWGPPDEPCWGIPKWPLFSQQANSSFAVPNRICSCIGRGGVEGVRLWGPEGEACGGFAIWGRYTETCVDQTKAETGVCSCIGKGNVLAGALKLWGPKGELCGGMSKDGKPHPDWGLYEASCKP